MLSFTDQTGHTLALGATPQRIVSLVPSQTELLFDLGLEEQVVGITKFCVHPKHWSATKTKTGGTKTVKMSVVAALQPDLIIANKEENTRADIESLRQRYPVWISDISNLTDAVQMIEAIGNMTGKQPEATNIIDAIQYKFGAVEKRAMPVKTAYLIWRNPYMTVGADTFIHAMLQACGFDNCFKQLTRYPIVSIEQLQQCGCELLLLSSEPFPFKQRHIDELQAMLPDTEIMLVDGEYFSWYGSRLLQAPAYFNTLLHQLQ